MKTLHKILLLLVATGIVVSCKKTVNNGNAEKAPRPVIYENDLFSIKLPSGWDYDDRNWGGLDSILNEVDFYGPEGCPVWLHCVKAFFPFQWKNIGEATEMAKTAESLRGEDVILLTEIDSLEIGGYPTTILLYAHFEENDTIIQKLHVTYLHDSHIVVYVNENFYYNNADVAQDIGDPIVETILFKKVKNPFDNKEVLDKAMEDLTERTKDSEQVKKVKELIEETKKEQ